MESLNVKATNYRWHDGGLAAVGTVDWVSDWMNEWILNGTLAQLGYTLDVLKNNNDSLYHIALYKRMVKKVKKTRL